MNKERRSAIAKVREAAERLKGEIEQLASEERDAFDNNAGRHSAKRQRAKGAEAAADALDEAASTLDEVISSLETAAE